MYASNRPSRRFLDHSRTLAGATTRVVVADSADHERTAETIETMARLARERQELSQWGLPHGDGNAAASIIFAIATSTADFQGAMAFFQRSPVRF